MGRPLRKDILGTDAIGKTEAGDNTGVRVEFYDGSTLITDGYIHKQRGAKTFVVSSESDGSNRRYTCVLQNSAPNADDEMRLWGYTGGGNGGTQVNLAKITKRVATDFSGNKYTWYLENDSSNDYIVLTAI